MIPQKVLTQLSRIQSKMQSWFGKKQKSEPPKPTKPKTQTYELEANDAQIDPDRIRPTKAYADQRQKSPRNRRHRPSKAMRNLYQLQ